jgi:hypothetical protein
MESLNLDGDCPLIPGTSWRNANGKGSGSQRNRHVYDGVPPSVPLGNFLMFRGMFRQLW